MSYNLVVSFLLEIILPGIPFVGFFFLVLTVTLAGRLTFWQLYFTNVFPMLFEFSVSLPKIIISTAFWLPTVLNILKTYGVPLTLLNYVNIVTITLWYIPIGLFSVIFMSLLLTVLMKVVNRLLPKRLKPERIGY